MRNISEPSRHRAPIATSRRRWDPRSVGSRPHRRLRLRHRIFGSVVFVNPWELEAHLWLKRTTTSRAFPWSKFGGHTIPTRRAVSKKVRICISDLNFGPQAQPPQSKEATFTIKEAPSTTGFTRDHIPTNKGDNNRQEPRRKEATSTSLRPTSSSKNLLTWN